MSSDDANNDIVNAPNIKTPTLRLVSQSQQSPSLKNSVQGVNDDNEVAMKQPPNDDSCDSNSSPNDSSHSDSSHEQSNVVSIFTGESVESSEVGIPILRVIPETHGNRMLYSNPDAPDRLVAVPLLCWAMDAKGNVFGMVPWLDEILPCSDVEEKYCVTWEGYYSATMDEIFFEPSEDIMAQLQLNARYPTGCYHTIDMGETTRHVVQEFADPIGTHALLTKENDDGLLLTSVISWVLDEVGQLHPMLVDDNKLEKLPALPGDDCLYSAYDALNFRCLFQRDIADQIRTNNPDTMEAIEQLFS